MSSSYYSRLPVQKIVNRIKICFWRMGDSWSSVILLKGSPTQKKERSVVKNGGRPSIDRACIVSGCGTIEVYGCWEAKFNSLSLGTHCISRTTFHSPTNTSL